MPRLSTIILSRAGRNMMAPKKQMLKPIMGTRAKNLIEGWLEKRNEENARQVVAVVRNTAFPVSCIT